MTCSVPGCDRKHNALGLCKKHYDKQHKRRRRVNDAEHKKKYYAANKARISERWKSYWRREETQRKYRDRHLRKTYCLTLTQYEQLLELQGHRCKICSADKPGGNFKNFHVDHNHSTGKVRGLLCYRCNSMLGFAKESVDVFLSAVRYLNDQASHSD